MALEKALLDILVCPTDKQPLLYFADESMLYNPRLRRRYRIEDGIPVMLEKEAVPVTESEHEVLMARGGDPGPVSRRLAIQAEPGPSRGAAYPAAARR
jgi:uncharacterized protein